ncbi:uracil-DNA glycosylase [Sphingomonas sp. G-3-2-10]|uniref:uracil-DNA glycosylase family protein n=1 Tax=Sphingomonas sp. G-3-2-10 TaxID=2728838 RepID=UPI00146BD2A5|nr:uracil-DNA glycosylase [Sphingomonas sp. G-3-2-10]
MKTSTNPGTEPDRDCPLCPRLVETREALRIEQPDWWNAPVPAYGDPDAAIAIVGLAPGRAGANRTGLAFTGDGSGDMLFATLEKFGLAERGVPKGVMILNAVKCLPPGNKPVPEEIRNCRPFLEAQFDAMPNLRVAVALGEIAHQSSVKALGGKLPKCRFAHLAEHRVPSGMLLIDSYHCSRYNQNTGRITPGMFEAVFARAVELAA